jgi:hypothetical protein
MFSHHSTAIYKLTEEHPVSLHTLRLKIQVCYGKNILKYEGRNSSYSYAV